LMEPKVPGFACVLWIEIGREGVRDDRIDDHRLDHAVRILAYHYS
jgi:hypothetical protein